MDKETYIYQFTQARMTLEALVKALDAKNQPCTELYHKIAKELLQEWAKARKEACRNNG